MLGPLHWISASAALLLAAAVFARPKGTRTHRVLGWTYAVCMLIVNGAALSVYEMSGRWGPFHWLALVSLATLCAGMLPAVRKPGGRRRDGWLGYHSHLMAWSTIGLAAAGTSQLAVQIYPNWYAVIAATGLTMMAGSWMIRRYIPGATRRAGKPGPGPATGAR